MDEKTDENGNKNVEQLGENNPGSGDNSLKGDVSKLKIYGAIIGKYLAFASAFAILAVVSFASSFAYGYPNFFSPFSIAAVIAVIAFAFLIYVYSDRYIEKNADVVTKKKALNILTIVLFVIIGCVGGFFYYQGDKANQGNRELYRSVQGGDDAPTDAIVDDSPSPMPSTDAGMNTPREKFKSNVFTAVSYVILCLDRSAWISNPETGKPVCKEFSYTWPDLSKFGGAQWGGCNLEVDKEGDFKYCATFNGEKLICTQAGCSF